MYRRDRFPFYIDNIRQDTLRSAMRRTVVSLHHLLPNSSAYYRHCTPIDTGHHLPRFHCNPFLRSASRKLDLRPCSTTLNNTVYCAMGSITSFIGVQHRTQLSITLLSAGSRRVGAPTNRSPLPELYVTSGSPRLPVLGRSCDSLVCCYSAALYLVNVVACCMELYSATVTAETSWAANVLLARQG